MLPPLTAVYFTHPILTISQFTRSGSVSCMVWLQVGQMMISLSANSQQGACSYHPVPSLVLVQTPAPFAPQRGRTHTIPTSRSSDVPSANPQFAGSQSLRNSCILDCRDRRDASGFPLGSSSASHAQLTCCR